MPIYTIDDLRSSAPKTLQGQSDEALIGEYAKRAGRDPFEVADYLGFKTGKASGPVRAGLSSGVDQLQGLGASALGGVSDGLGLKGPAKYFNDAAQDQQYQAQLNGRPDLERLEDQSLGSAGPFAAYQIAKNLPTMAAVAGAEFIPGVGQAAGALGLSRLGAVAPRVVGGGGLRAGADFAAKRAALAQGEALASSAAVGTGVGYGSLYQESVDGGNPDPYGSVLKAIPYGLTEAALPAAVRGAFRTPGQLTGNLLTRTGKAAGLGFVGEAGTESIQNELEMSQRSDLTADDIASRRLNSAVVGGLVGGSLGSLGGIPSRAVNPNGTTDLLNPESESTSDTTGAPLQLGYNPNAGVMTAFPDGSVALNSDQAFDKRYAPQRVPTSPFETAGEPTGQFLAESEYDLSNQRPRSIATPPAAPYPMDSVPDLPTELGAAPTGESEDGQTTDIRQLLGRDGARLGLQPMQGRLEIGQGRDSGFAPTTSNEPLLVGRPGETAANEAQNEAMLDPGATEARRQYQAQAAEQQTLRAATEARKAEIDARDARAQAAGLQGTKAFDMFGRLEQAVTDGLITKEQMALELGNLTAKNPRYRQVEKFLDGRAATKEATTNADKQDAAATSRLILDKTPNKSAAPTAAQDQNAAGSAARPAPVGPTSPAPVDGAKPAQPLGLVPLDDGKTVTVGRTDRPQQTLTKAQLKEKLAKAGTVDRQRYLLAMGYELDEDPDTGAPTYIQTSDPRTFDQVAALEGKMTGKKPVGRNAISSSLLKFGITEDVINKTAAAAVPESVSPEEMGIQKGDAGGAEAAGVRVEDSVSKVANEGLVEGRPLKKSEIAAKEMADALLADKKLPPPTFMAKHMVETEVFDQESGQFVRKSESAEKALKALKDDLTELQAFRKCVGS